MSEFIPKPGTVKVGGLGRKAQKLQALRDKAAQQKAGGKPQFDSASSQAMPKSSFAGGKKPNFNRKAV